MLKVAITGNIGSGKSTVVHFFELLGIPVFSADISGHKALLCPEVISALKSVFGDVIFDEKGIPNRKKIGAIVFSDYHKLLKLNEITHPVIKSDIAQWFEQQSEKSYAVCEVAVLFEAHFEALFDKIITVSAPESLRIERVAKRDALPQEMILKRIHSQMDEKVKIEKSDFCILNDEKHSIIQQVLKIHEALLSSANE